MCEWTRAGTACGGREGWVSLGMTLSSISFYHVTLGKMFTSLSLSFSLCEMKHDDDDDTSSTGLWRGWNERARVTSLKHCSWHIVSAQQTIIITTLRVSRQNWGHWESGHRSGVSVSTSVCKSQSSLSLTFPFHRWEHQGPSSRRNWAQVSLGTSVGTAVWLLTSGSSLLQGPGFPFTPLLQLQPPLIRRNISPEPLVPPWMLARGCRTQAPLAFLSQSWGQGGEGRPGASLCMCGNELPPQELGLAAAVCLRRTLWQSSTIRESKAAKTRQRLITLDNRKLGSGDKKGV